MEHKAFTFVALATGIVLGFLVWSYVSPYLSNVSTVPSA